MADTDRITLGRADRVALAGDGCNMQTATLPGDTFDLQLDTDDEELVATVTRGSPVVEQVLRRLNSEPGRVVLDDGDVLVAVAEASHGEDLAVYRRGLSHRLLYRRTWRRSGRNVVWVGFNPFLAEFDGDPYDTSADQRKSFQVVYSAARAPKPLSLHLQSSTCSPNAPRQRST